MAYYDVNFITQFIRQEAIKRGIDPDVALRVARSEGLKANTWQSNVRNKQGVRETSYGPYQLYDKGGLGNKFEQVTGHQVEDPRFVKEQVTFALDEASRGGWTPWHGWKGNRWAGIRTPATANVSDVMDVGGLARGAKMQAENYNLSETGEGGAISDMPPDSIGELLGDELQGDEKKEPLSGLLAELIKTPDAQPLQLQPPPAAASNVQSLPEYIQQYIAMRKFGGQPPGGGGMGGQGLG